MLTNDFYIIFAESDGAEAWSNVSEEDKIAMNYYEMHSVSKQNTHERICFTQVSGECLERVSSAKISKIGPQALGISLVLD